MRLLAMETSEYQSSIALWEDKIIYSESFPSRMDLCATLTARLQAMLQKAGLYKAPPDIWGNQETPPVQAIAVSLGPGSFTGLRIGIATAKALAHVWRIPLLGIPTQEALAAEAPIEEGERALIVQYARQGFYYAGLWTRQKEKLIAEIAPQVVSEEQLISLGRDSAMLAGPAAELAQEKIGHRLPPHLRLHKSLPQAATIALLAAERIQHSDPHAAFTLQPLYLLASQAERLKNIFVTDSYTKHDQIKSPAFPSDKEKMAQSEPPSRKDETAPMCSEKKGDLRQGKNRSINNSLLQLKHSSENMPQAIFEQSSERNVGRRAYRPKLCLRRARLEDLPAIIQIENVSFSSPWPEQSLRDEILREHNNLFCVAELEGEIVGYIGAWMYAQEAHIYTIAVHPDFRRQGIGEIMMLTILRQAQKQQANHALLEYRVSNEEAAQLYAKIGFEVLYRRRGYYQDNNEDALVAALQDLAAWEQQERLQRLHAEWQEKHSYELCVAL